MVQQSLQEVRVIDPILTNFAHGYRMPALVGMLLFPAVPVLVSGGQVLEFGREDFVRYNLRRAPGDPKKRISFGHKGKTYALYQDALEAPLPYEHMRDARVMPGIDLGKVRTRKLMNVLQLQLECEQAEIARNPDNYGNNNKQSLSGNDKFSSANCVPKTLMDSWKNSVRREIGIEPNVAIAGPEAFDAAANNPDVKNQYRYTSPESITADLLARYFQLDRFVKGMAISRATVEAASTDVWGNDIVLGYVPPEVLSNPTYAPNGMVDMETPSFAYTYVMEGHPFVEQPYDDKTCDSWIYPGKYERAPVLTGMGAGFLAQNVA